MKVFLIFADEGEEILAFAEYGEFGGFPVILHAGGEMIAEPGFVHPRHPLSGITGEKSGRTGVIRVLGGIPEIPDAVREIGDGEGIFLFGKCGVGDFPVIHGQHTLDGIAFVAFIHHFVNDADEPSVTVERIGEGQIFHFGETVDLRKKFHQIAAELIFCADFLRTNLLK